MLPHKSLSTTMSHLVLLPLRLFLDITFVYAGIQKLTAHGSLCFTKLDDKPLHTEEISINSAVEIGSGGRLSF